jgi:hypothetical protein
MPKRMWVVGLVLLVAGCGAFKSDAPPIDVNRAVASGTTLGTLCAAIPVEAPNEVETAARAVRAAYQVLTQPAPDLSAVQIAASKAGPKAAFYINLGVAAALSSAAIGGVGPTDLIAPGSPVNEGMKALFRSCLASMGQMVMAAQGFGDGSIVGMESLPDSLGVG